MTRDTTRAHVSGNVRRRGMPSHPPRSQPFKKQEILEKREEELEHALRNGFPHDKVRAAAENIRTAHLNLLKGKIAQFQRYTKDDSDNPLPGAKARRDYELWEKLSVDEIIAKYMHNA